MDTGQFTDSAHLELPTTPGRRTMAVGSVYAAAGAGDRRYRGRITAFVALSCVTAALGASIFGYDLGSSGGASSMEPFLREFFSEVHRRMEGGVRVSNYCKFDSQLLTLFTSSLYIAGLLAAMLLSSWFTARHGRRPSMIVGGVAFVACAAISGAAVNVYMVILGRALLGVGLGFANQAVLLYLSEMAPARYRGAFSNGFQLSLCLGSLAANVINFGAAKITGGWGWRLSLGLAGVPAVFFTLGAIFLPETPNSLVQQGEDLGKVRALLQKIRGTDAVDDELDDIVAADSAATGGGAGSGLRMIFSQRRYRPQLVIAVLMPAFTQLNGINAIGFYAAVLIRTIGMGESASLLAGVITVLIYTASTVMLVSEVLIGAVMAAKLGDEGEMDRGYAAALFVLIGVYVAGYSCSWGPMTWLVPTEVFPLEIRLAGQSVTVASGFVFTIFVAQGLLANVLCRMRAWLFFFFAGWIVVMTAFVHLFLPETKGLPIEQIGKDTILMAANTKEAVTRLLSSVTDKYEETSNTKEHMDRMEMAHIKLEAALEMSDRWSLSSAPLLRWRSKLKRVMQECDDTLRRCRQRLQEEEEEAELVNSSPFPKRIAHSARSLISSIFSGRSSEEASGGSTVRRFEWFADGASEFLRYVELGGAPRQHLFFDPLVRHLLAGKGTEYFCVHGGQRLSFFLRPFTPLERGTEGRMVFLLEDGNAPQNNFLLTLSLRLSDSTDVVGVAARCLEVFMPHMSSTAETVKTKLTQLPTQDLRWLPYDEGSHTGKGHWDDLHMILYKGFQRNPLCCQQPHDDRYPGGSTLSSSDMHLEPVDHVYLKGHVPLSSGHGSQSSVPLPSSPTKDSPYLRLGGIFLPHSSSKDLPAAVAGSASAAAMVDVEEAAERSTYANVSFEQLGEIVVPKAVDRLCGDAGATSCQMLWKSRHGGAYLQVEKTTWRAAGQEDKGRKRRRRRGKELPRWARGITDFIGSSSLVVHAPTQLQGLISDWIEKERQVRLAL
ncbi:hypothetical protein ACP70R_008357 [Stipagrostis hirtigluma subsp. patula]